jgi:hypothetical protein
MEIRAFDENQNEIMVEINPEGQRHASANGKCIDLHQRVPMDLEHDLNNALDAIFDLPIFRDGAIYTSSGSVKVWMEAKKI